jgi:biopolymer transport protein ExbD
LLKTRKLINKYYQETVFTIVNIFGDGLLIFFMMTTTFITQWGMRINLPVASSKEKNVSAETNTIIIIADSQIHFNRQTMRDVEELRSQLMALKKTQASDVIIVKADETVAHGVVVRVMDIARTSGFSRIAIATKQ